MLERACSVGRLYSEAQLSALPSPVWAKAFHVEMSDGSSWEYSHKSVPGWTHLPRVTCPEQVAASDRVCLPSELACDSRLALA